MENRFLKNSFFFRIKLFIKTMAFIINYLPYNQVKNRLRLDNRFNTGGTHALSFEFFNCTLTFVLFPTADGAVGMPRAHGRAGPELWRGGGSGLQHPA